MPIRYTDITSAKDTPADFVPRNRKPTTFELILIFIAAIALSVVLPILVMNKLTLISWLCLIISAGGWFVVVEILRSRDIILATEFQNALFASALGFSNKFCLIIKREGSVVYMDPGFQKMFPDLIRERAISISSMMKHGKVAAADREKIFSAIDRGVYDKAIFEIKAPDGKMVKIVMSIEPIIRPSGFILLRARDFVEKRERQGDDVPAGAEGMSNPLLSKSNIALFAYIMDRMNTGVYITDPEGQIIFANRIVEQWLSYRESEITGKNLTLRNIVHQGSSDTEAITPANFEGEITMQKKEGGLIKAFINQKVVLDDAQKLLGCVALVNNIIEKDPNAKKALW